MKVAGFGFRKDASADSLAAAYQAAGGQADALATVADKATAPAMAELARRMALPIHAVAAETLAAAPVETRSEKSQARFGTGSLCEATALVAAGAGARLLARRVISPDRMATCAIAEGEPE